MNVKMTQEDRRAMDILLDRSVVAAGKTNGTTVYAAVDDDVRRRVAAVGKVLAILDNATASDPPRQLLERTLRLVEQTSGRAVSARAGSQPMHPAYSGMPPLA